MELEELKLDFLEYHIRDCHSIHKPDFAIYSLPSRQARTTSDGPPPHVTSPAGPFLSPHSSPRHNDIISNLPQSASN
jgi:hypothetical protein